MPRLTRSVPSYRKHKASGQAIVTIAGRDYYLGPWKSKASRLEYDRLIAEWLARGREPDVDPHGISIVRLIARYWKHCRTYYRKDGKPTGELDNIRDALRPVETLYGDTDAADFGPLQLKVVRNRMIESGLCRPVINVRVQKVKRMFRWAVSERLVPADLLPALDAVEGLKQDRCDAPEPEPVEKVADEIVDATLPHLPKVVADMVRFQRLTGCRPSEVCQLRPCDIDRAELVWAYRPATHKMAHRGRERVIFIGPKAQEILLPYLLRDSCAYCFSPAESEARRKAERRAERKMKVQPSQLDRSKPNPVRKPKDRYTTASYRTAVHRGCDKAFGDAQGPITWAELVAATRRGKLTDRDMVRDGNRNRWRRAKKLSGLFNGVCVPSDGDVAQAATWFLKEAIPRWSPNQVRHSVGTAIRKEYGLEGSQVVLGHSRADVTQIYAERDLKRAADIMREVG